MSSQSTGNIKMVVVVMLVLCTCLCLSVCLQLAAFMPTSGMWYPQQLNCEQQPGYMMSSEQGTQQSNYNSGSGQMMSTEETNGGSDRIRKVSPNSVQNVSGQWKVDNPSGESGIFAVMSEGCGYCKKLQQTVNQAQNIKPFNFSFMNTEDSGYAKMQEMQISAVPQIYRMDEDGYLSEYTGHRTPDNLIRNSYVDYR